MSISRVSYAPKDGGLEFVGDAPQNSNLLNTHEQGLIAAYVVPQASRPRACFSIKKFSTKRQPSTSDP